MTPLRERLTTLSARARELGDDKLASDINWTAIEVGRMERTLEEIVRDAEEDDALRRGAGAVVVAFPTRAVVGRVPG